MISIIIRDAGIGLTESVRTHLFEPFFSSKSRIGAGLGLSAAYGIVKSHGGSISITDTPGQGVTVTISLPVMQAAQRDEMQPKGYVLIVDDEQEIAEATAMTLRREGYAVFTSTSCQDAFRLFEQVGAKIDLIILDNQLGSTKGTSCAQELLSRAPHLPILFYSGADDDLELMAFIKNIGAGWLKKPFSSHELLSHINSLIVKKKVPA
jgi:CheY-like chemotaxis protein